MRLTTTRQLAMLALAAAVPAGLGLATHLDHRAAEQACLTAAAEPAPPTTVALPVATPIVSEVLVDPMAGAVEFAFVIDLGTPHIVLATAGATEELALETAASNAPHFRGPAGSGVLDQPVWRDVDLEDLPIHLRAAVGRHVRVYSPAGRVCTAKIGIPSLVSESEGSIDYLPEDEVELAAENGDEGPKVEPASVWDDGRRTLVAPLVGNDCAGATWARDFAFSEPLIFFAQASGEGGTVTPDDLPSPVARRLVQRSAELAPVAAAFAEHVAGFDDEAFTTRRLTDRLVGRSWVEPLHGTRLDVFETDGGEFGGCGGFDPAWAAIGTDGEGNPAAPVWVDTATDTVQSVVDLEGDGRLEVIAESWGGPTELIGLDLAGPRNLATLSEVPFYGCPC